MPSVKAEAVDSGVQHPVKPMLQSAVQFAIKEQNWCLRLRGCDTGRCPVRRNDMSDGGPDGHGCRQADDGIRVARAWVGRPGPSLSAPAECRGNMLQDCLENMHIILNAKLVRHRQQQRVRFGNGLIPRKLID